MAKRLAQQVAERGGRPDAVTLTLNKFGVAEDVATPMPGVVIDGTEGASVQLANCCRPIPGDAIRGYLGRGEGLLVHTAECSIGKRLADRDPERWIAVEWAEQPTRNFETSVKLLVKNGKGALAQLAAAVSAAEADISHIEMEAEPLDDATELRLLLAVRDRLHLADVLRALKRSPPVMRATRVKP